MNRMRWHFGKVKIREERGLGKHFFPKSQEAEIKYGHISFS